MNDLAQRIANLSPEKRQKLEMQLKAKGLDYTRHINTGVHNLYPAIEPAPVNDVYPVSSAQKRMFLLSRMEEKSANYNVPQATLIEGALEREKLEKAFAALIERHEILRTSFEMADGQLVQRVHPRVDFKVDYQELPEDKVAEAVSRFIQPFDLSCAPLLRVRLIRLQEQRSLLLYDMHHIVTDGISLGILMREFIDLYEEKPLPELRIQYKDYAAWQNQLFQKGIIGKQAEFWRNCFTDEIPSLNLPLDNPRPAILSFAGEMIQFAIGPELTGRLKQMASESGATLYIVLLAAFNVLLFKYSGQEDIIVGSPVAGRPNPDLENIIGIFINTLALRNYPAGAKSFREFLEEVKERSIQAFQHQDYPFEDLVDTLGLQRDLSRNPLFDVMFILQNISLYSRETAGLKFSPYPLESKIAKFDLTLQAMEIENRIEMVIEYGAKLFKPQTITRLFGHFQNILQSVIANPETPLAAIEMLSIEERRRVLSDFNETQAEYSTGKTIHQLFEDQVSLTPERIAVVFAGQSLTYRELNAKANQLAGRLRSQGAHPGCFAAIMVNRSLEMIIGILGILKAGSAYLPIDPDYPAERVNCFLDDSGADLLLVQGQVKPGIKKGLTIVEINSALVSEEEAAKMPAVAKLDKNNNSNDPAYLIYTSGTTGRPKGVLVEHQSIANNLMWRKQEYGFGEDDVILQLFSYVFDGFLTSFFTPVISGAKVLLLTDEEAINPVAIKNWIAAQKVTHFISVPSLYQAILNVLTPEDSRSLRIVTLAGERPAPQLIEQSKAKNAALELVNEYGPTESTVVASVYRDMRPGDVISIGKPIANSRIYILSKFNQPQPIGIPGELWIAGAGVTRGYLNQPELTAEKFIPNPFIDGSDGVFHVETAPPQEGAPPTEGIHETSLQKQRIYRTGDLARWLPDGNLEFSGRLDHQVKIRGYRIELGEIEARLLKYKSVSEAIVTAGTDQEGDAYLCAYLTAWRELTAQELRNYLANQLPEYMIPSYFIQLDQLPFTPNGKIDRRRLPKPQGNIHTGKSYAAPRDEIERKLVGIWQELLGVEPVGIEEDFFELGGHSLKAAVLTARIHKELQVELTLPEIFKTPTIKELAAAIKTAETAGYSAISPTAPKEDYPLGCYPTGCYPASSAQKRLHFISQLVEAGTSYNMPGAMIIEGVLNRERLEVAFQGLIDRHEALRTSFELIDGAPVQRIHERVQFAIGFRKAMETEVDEIIKAFIRPFDLKKAPLLRVILVELNPAKHLLLYDMSHIIGDGLSMDILVREFLRLYDCQTLPELRIQYKDFAAWQNELFSSSRIQTQEAYWLQTFSGELPVLALPTDYPRMAAPSFEGDQVFFDAGSELKAGIYRLAATSQMTVYMILLAAYSILLARYSGQADIIIGSPIAGRTHADLENIIGMFVNTLAMRNYPSGDKTLAGFLAEVKCNTLQAFANQDYQFEELVDKLKLPRNLSRNPLFDAEFVLQNRNDSTNTVSGLRFTPYPFHNETAKFDLTLQAQEVGEGIRFSLNYRTRLFRSETIERMAMDYLKILEMMVTDLNTPLNEIKLMGQAIELDWAIKEEVTFDF